MGGMECVITGVMDEFQPLLKKWRYSREVFTFSATFVSFLVSITNITKVTCPVFAF